MKDEIMTASPARIQEWARVAGLLPWADAPAWAPFAVKHCGRWFWMEKPPASIAHDSMEVSGRVLEFETPPAVCTPESLFLRPRHER